MAAAAEAEASRPTAVAEHEAAAVAAADAEQSYAAAAAKAKELREEFEAELGMGAGATGEGAKNLQGQLSDVTADVKAQETAIKQASMRVQAFAKDVALNEKAFSAASKTGDKASREHARLESAVAAASEKLAALGHDTAAEEALANSHSAAAAEHARLVQLADETAAAIGGAAEFRYRDPEPRFDRSRVKGSVASNLRVPDSAHATALEALAGGKLHQVIVDNEKTGMLLLTKGGLQRRVTLIPLSKIKPTPPTPAQLNQVYSLVGSRAVAATSLVECDTDMRPAIDHVFGASFVCKDREAARLVCEKLRLKSVTLEGDLYDPQGTLTGGSRPRGSASLLVRMGQLADARHKASHAAERAAKAEAMLVEARKRGEEHEALASELEMQKHRLAVHKATMQAGEAHALSVALEESRAKLSQAQQEEAAAKTALETAKARQDALQARISDFKGNREEQLARSKKAIAAADKESAAKAKALASAQQAEQKMRSRLESLDAQIAAADASSRAESASSNRAAAEAEVNVARDAYDAAEAAVANHRRAIAGHSERLAQISSEIDAAQRAATDAKVELKTLEHKCARAEKERAQAERNCNDLLNRNPWMEAERDSFGEPGGEFDFSNAKHVAKQRAALGSQAATLSMLAKKVNKKVLSMFEKAEAEYADLMEKKATVERDKAKIEAVIAECAHKKVAALHATWSKVNADFGAIFSTLLPGTNAKLEPEEGKSVEDGLCVKVAFGQVWKQSLLELSGGQRSLVALSLVLSLLRFKPAPVYILDEIDAALDLSHTQNIGAMIKSHFQQSQFLVVSLKEGMFNNANVLFRTKFVDGVSTITRTVPSGADRAAAGQRENESAQRGKAVAVGNAQRKALTQVN